MFCPKCSSNIPDNAVHCPNCGAALSSNNAVQVQNQFGDTEKQGGMGFGIASMVLGILSILCSCCFYYLSIPLSIVGLILGAIAVHKKNRGRGMAIAGLVLSIISLGLGIVVMISGAALLSSMGFDSMF